MKLFQLLPTTYMWATKATKLAAAGKKCGLIRNVLQISKGCLMAASGFYDYVHPHRELFVRPAVIRVKDSCEHQKANARHTAERRRRPEAGPTTEQAGR